MRAVAQIPHQDFKITVFGTDHYYYVEIEAGPMKQAYKLPKDKAPNIDAVQKWLNSGFLEETHRIFELMYTNHISSIREQL